MNPGDDSSLRCLNTTARCNGARTGGPPRLEIVLDIRVNITCPRIEDTRDVIWQSA